MQKFLKLLGIVFLVIGVAGFIPGLAEVNADGQLLLGIFQINYFQSLFHILSGVAALAATGTKKDYYILNYLKVFGAVYLVLALWGIPALAGDTYNGVLFNLVHVNAATTVLHIAIAGSVIYVGMKNMPKKTAAPTPASPAV